jgi:hypothetical protein
MMWRDIVLGDWLFDFDWEDEIKKLTPAVLAMLADRKATAAKVSRAREVVRERQEETMAVVGRSAAAGAARDR